MLLIFFLIPYTYNNINTFGSKKPYAPTMYARGAKVIRIRGDNVDIWSLFAPNTIIPCPSGLRLVLCSKFVRAPKSPKSDQRLSSKLVSSNNKTLENMFESKNRKETGPNLRKKSEKNFWFFFFFKKLLYLSSLIIKRQ